MPRLLSLLLFLTLAPLLHADPPAPAQVRTDFRKLLDRPKVALDVKLEATKIGDDGMLRETLSYATDKKPDGSIERVPTLILSPAKGRGKLPAVIVLHGTGGNKEAMLPFMQELVKRNIIAVAIDARYHGARAGGAKGANAYNEAIVQAWQTKPGSPQEHPFYYDTCWDLWRLIDYLETRPEIDAKRLGMIGFSMGGIQTWLVASVDERIAVAVPAIAVQSFRWSLENEAWQGRANTIKAAHTAAAKDLGEKDVNAAVCKALWAKVIPGITDEFDCPSMLRLFAPRPLLILNGTKDANCPLAGAKLAIAAAEKAYDAAGARSHLRVDIADVGHTVTAAQRELALEFFSTWLSKDKN